MTGTWSVVSGQDLAQALAHDAFAWPAVLRPAARASHEPSARLCAHALCAHALRAAASAPVRAVHWFLHPDCTIIAESAHGPRQSIILAGRVPHVPDPTVSRGPTISSGPTADPGLLLLGTSATSAVCARLADLLGPAQDAPALQDVPALQDARALTEPATTTTAGATSIGATSATAVLTRWVLPAECPPLPARFVTDLRAGLLERALITDLAAALARVQASGESTGRTRT